MSKRLPSAFLASSVIFLVLTWPCMAAEKLQFGTPIKLSPSNYLPILAAEERGFWRQNGLEVEWVVTGSTISLHHAISAGALKVGMEMATGIIAGIGRGVPLIMVASVQNSQSAALWVRADSPVKEPKDLKKGARVGVTSLGGTIHAYGRMLLRALGMEKDVRFVGMGGIPNAMAILKAGAVDAIVMGPFPMAPLQVKGEVRAVAWQEDHIRTKLAGDLLWTRKDLLKSNPEVVSRVTKAVLQSTVFLSENQKWATKKMEEEQGLPPVGAEAVYKKLDFSGDGKISREAVENTRNFLIEYELMPKDKTPVIEELYTRQFTG